MCLYLYRPEKQLRQRSGILIGLCENHTRQPVSLSLGSRLAALAFSFSGSRRLHFRSRQALALDLTGGFLGVLSALISSKWWEQANLTTQRTSGKDWPGGAIVRLREDRGRQESRVGRGVQLTIKKMKRSPMVRIARPGPSEMRIASAL